MNYMELNIFEFSVRVDDRLCFFCVDIECAVLEFRLFGKNYVFNLKISNIEFFRKISPSLKSWLKTQLLLPARIAASIFSCEQPGSKKTSR